MLSTVKYWGKADENLIIPVNDSLSGTLDVAQLCATTSVATGPDVTSDRIWLNGREEDIQNKRLQNCLQTSELGTEAVVSTPRRLHPSSPLTSSRPGESQARRSRS